MTPTQGAFCNLSYNMESIHMLQVLSPWRVALAQIILKEFGL